LIILENYAKNFNNNSNRTVVEKVMQFRFQLIEEDIKNLENLLIKSAIQENNDYKQWFDDFKKIYGKGYTSVRLYISFSIIYFIGHVLFLKEILKTDIEVLDDQSLIEKLKVLQIKTLRKYPDSNLFSLNYFNPFFNCLGKLETSNFTKILRKVSKIVFKLELPPEYIFDLLLQNLISPMIRHKSGEFYTPPFIVQKMVEESYEFGEKVLDPCCGSGNFLIEIIKKIISSEKTEEEKISAINNVYGFDINPISIFTTRINFLLLLEEKLNEININLHVFDSLFQNGKKSKFKFDLVIGNPPWYTLSDINSTDYQSKIKDLSDKLEIKPLPKNILNIEIAALFFYKAKFDYMKEGAKIFFVMTKGVITGSHASRFRNFKGFDGIKIWMFNKQIENIFNIDFICLFAQKFENIMINEDSEIPVYYFSVKDEKTKLDYFEKMELKLESKSKLVPYFIQKKGGKIFTSKLVPKNDYNRLLPHQESEYKKLFHKGADLNPRNLIFVQIENLNGSQVKINPDERIFKRAKQPWNKEEFEDVIIEKQYIFKVIKSTELVKFHIYDHYNVFLPISKHDLSFNYANLTKKAKFFYDRINNVYLTYKKETTKNRSLMDNLNRWSKLINPRQKSKIKVVYNNSGSILNSAVIEGDFIVTGDLSFFDTEDLNEAYYLSAILNSPLMTEQIQIKKSSRHIFKLPFDIAIKKYNPAEKNHHLLTELAKRAQEIAKITITNLIKKERNIPSKFKIQKTLSKEQKLIIDQIDKILIEELKF